MSAHPITERAVNGWEKCGLTPAQKRTETLYLCHRLEEDRKKLIEALNAIVESAMDEGGEQLYVGQQNIEYAANLLSQLGDGS